MVEQRYPYRSEVWMLILILTGVMVVMTAILAFVPFEGDTDASAFVPFMGLLIVPMACFTGWAYLRERGSARAIIFGVDAISAPPNALSGRIVTMPYADITDAHILSLKNNTTLRITATNETIGIPVSAVGDAETLDEVLAALLVRIEKAKSDA
ncbi:hypothetical protein SAMN06273572_1011169 [Monaibacterium marinum]|uniref:Uncharacterized protein n=1 Tax=Pontivivens marinum TaxID=1690039 RepID=A0A2C9CQ20_9RHOB|nr:hypothetical protein [Monaibacterium marinum]SOH93313.1 hypothetical protein SAMN06273572_1011169 [Monaibacterium marinum]